VGSLRNLRGTAPTTPVVQSPPKKLTDSEIKTLKRNLNVNLRKLDGLETGLLFCYPGGILVFISLCFLFFGYFCITLTDEPNAMANLLFISLRTTKLYSYAFSVSLIGLVITTVMTCYWRSRYKKLKEETVEIEDTLTENGIEMVRI
jgi:hypothetical protein